MQVHTQSLDLAPEADAMASQLPEHPTPPRSEAMIEAEPFWSALGRLRRRPPVYGACSIVMAVSALWWSDPRALWIAVVLAAMTAAALFRTPGPETVITYCADIMALAAGVVFIGLEPTAAMALWTAIIVVVFWGLPKTQARLVLITAIAAIAVTFIGDGRWSILDLSDTARFAVGVALTVIGLAYLATVIPSLADATRQVLWAADDAVDVQRRQAEFRAQLASMVAHELRNPLAGIRGFVDVLVTEGDNLSPTDRHEYLSIVASQAVSLEGIVEDLLVAVQDEIGRVSVDDVSFDAAQLARRVVVELGPGVSEMIRIDVPVAEMAFGDPPRVSQIVRNLLSNAMKYGGPTIEISCRAVGDTVQVTVRDDGSGVASGDVVRIFERFEGTARGSSGYGLGLPISRTLAQAMGGDLTYRPGDGATFVLTLRAAPGIEPARDLATPRWS
jgi:signal transduction histidine kinase